ncbi:MAG: tetratricopeptide repeat protein [Spirochaetales bacterium]|nr:tetratricopeptide repeat protein [Spirochaetales bacterium]
MHKKLRFFTLISIIILTAGNLGAETMTDSEALLSSAEAAFKEGNELLLTDPAAAKEFYREAVSYYNSIISAGTVNSGLYYNMGNTYVRLDEIGYAILNYRKALLYSPNDAQIKDNLDYARSLQKNGFSINTENEILHILLFGHYLLPAMWKMIILIAANLVFWSSLITSRLGRAFIKTAVVSLIIALAMGGSFFIDIRSSKIMHGVVTKDSTIGRLGDSRSYESAFDAPLYQGVEFAVKQRRVGWILAELPNEELVWLEEADCGIVEEIKGN